MKRKAAEKQLCCSVVVSSLQTDSKFQCSPLPQAINGKLSDSDQTPESLTTNSLPVRPCSQLSESKASVRAAFSDPCLFLISLSLFLLCGLTAPVVFVGTFTPGFGVFLLVGLCALQVVQARCASWPHLPSLICSPAPPRGESESLRG